MGGRKRRCIRYNSNSSKEVFLCFKQWKLRKSSVLVDSHAIFCLPTIVASIVAVPTASHSISFVAVVQQHQRCLLLIQWLWCLSSSDAGEFQSSEHTYLLGDSLQLHRRANGCFSLQVSLIGEMLLPLSAGHQISLLQLQVADPQPLTKKSSLPLLVIFLVRRESFSL